MLGPREDDHQTGRRADQVCGTDLFKELASLAHRLETTAHVSGSENKKDTRAVTSEERGRKRLRVLRPRGIVEPQQAATPFDSSSAVVVRVADDALRRMSIKLFREYFSPSMHLIFPLIAFQQELHGLDFTTTQTWGVSVNEQPVGAVAWRVREPLMRAHARDAARLPMRLLEVLFISVWEEHRNSDYGGLLVAALEEEAQRSGCAMLYVEVGHEQPLARKFWAKRGFAPASERQVSQEQWLFFEYSCLRFSDTEPFIKRV